MDNIYGERCSVCGDFQNELEQGIDFSKEVLTKMLREIYDGLNVRDDIQRDAFEETLRIFNEATAEGLSASDFPTGDELFLEQLRTNNEVFSAFRTHRMQNDLAAQLIDNNGKLKPFEQWVKDVQNITDHYVVRWLRTEYDTAVLRAHQAADWKHFEAYQDVLPNLRWMPTTSPDPDIAHKQYWEAKLTLPVNHPFWLSHRPGDRWNCKCSLQATDEPQTTGAVGNFRPVPSVPGLDNNPADDGKLFSDSHPYYTEAYPGADKAVKKAVSQKIKFDYKQFISDNNIAKKVTITPKKSEEETFQKILNQLNLRMKEFNIPSFSEIGAPQSRKALASWDESDNSINFNLSQLNNPKKIWEKLEQWQKRGMKYDTISSEKDVVRAVVDHELGHKLLSQYHMKMDAIDTFAKAGVTRDGRNEVSEMGYYASTEEHEYFAEAFSMYMGPDRDKMGPLTRGMIERLIAKVNKK